MSAKRDMARKRYMEGVSQSRIASELKVSEKTVSQWVVLGNWETVRAGYNVTRSELVNKTLLAVNRLLDRACEEQNKDGELREIDLLNELPDKLSKYALFIEKMDKKGNVISVIDVFIAFGRWLQDRARFDKELTQDFIALLNHYQDLYIKESMS
jgi:predicted transcriptional regulator